MTQNVIISEWRRACYFKIGIFAQSSVANPDLQLNYKVLLLLILMLILLLLLLLLLFLILQWNSRNEEINHV